VVERVVVTDNHFLLINLEVQVVVEVKPVVVQEVVIHHL
jgi:hypothetical protein